MASTDPEHEPTHFEVLSISARSLDGLDPTDISETVKKAYRRALLKHHPDKQAQTSSTDNATASSATLAQHFTVDQITEAYNVLSDGQQRRKYTRTLRQQTKATSSSSTSANVPRRSKSKTAQVETVDLDDMSWSGKRRLYYHACRACGKARGFTVREDEVEDEDEDFELRVGCSGCEKELKVIVPALVDETDSEGEGDGSGLAAQQSQKQNLAPQQSSNNNAAPQKKSWGWGIRLGLGLGLSLGGGAGRSR